MKYVLMDLSYRYAVEVLDDIFFCLSQKKYFFSWHNVEWKALMESDRKSASYVSAIKGAAHIIKKQEFRSDGRRKAPRHPLPCPMYKLDF